MAKKTWRIIRAMICALKGHKLKADMEFRCYVRDGSRFKHNGRFFKCERCNTWIHVTGLLKKEVTEIMRATLKDLPQSSFEEAFASQTYDICRLFMKGDK